MTAKMSLEDVLDDLRFIINLPDEERASFERLGFQVEQAFWFYEDFYRPANSRLPPLNLRAFGKLLLIRYPPLIAPFGSDFDRLFDQFVAYKHAIPVCGAIILNDTLDKGWHSRSTWGFPKGKIGKDEDPADCAIREVLEETGFDITSRLSSSNYIDAPASSASTQTIRLFIIPGVSEHGTHFEPQTRKEISRISWHPIDALSSKNRDNKYYNVLHFVGKLKNWIKRNTGQAGTRANATTRKGVAGSVPKTRTGTGTGTPTRARNPPATTAPALESIFDKLRAATIIPHVKTVSVHETVSLVDTASRDSHAKTTDTSVGRIALIERLQAFCTELQSIQVRREVIGGAVDAAFKQ